MYTFEYHRPESIEAAVKILKDIPEGQPLAGGMSLVPTMKLRLSEPRELVDLNAIPDLRGIRREGDNLVIGAMTRHAEVAKSQIVLDTIPAIAQLAGGIGDPLCRNRGTIGGSVAFNDPVADYPAGLVGLGAEVHTSERVISAEDFFDELYETALVKGEIVTKIVFPLPEKAGWSKFSNLASRYAIVAVMASISGGIARVAVTGAKNKVFRVPEMEVRLNESFVVDAITGIKISADGMNEDIHADAEYRSNLVNVLASRAVESANV